MGSQKGQDFGGKVPLFEDLRVGEVYGDSEVKDTFSGPKRIHEGKTCMKVYRNFLFPSSVVIGPKGSGFVSVDKEVGVGSRKL